MSSFLTAVQRHTLLDMDELVRYFPRSRIEKYQLVGLKPGHGSVFNGGKASPLSLAYMISPRPICRLLFRHAVVCARIFARLNAGNNIAARIAMMAMTTSSSI